MSYLCIVLNIKQNNNKSKSKNNNNKKQKEMKTQRIKVIGKIKGTSYRNTSYYVSFENEEGETIKGYTAANAACAYGCTNSELREFACIVYHVTKGGKVIIDNIFGKSTYEKLIASK